MALLDLITSPDEAIRNQLARRRLRGISALEALLAEADALDNFRRKQ
jgi:hypothetical protein